MEKNRPSILIVDDEIPFCQMLEELLKEEGFEPISVNNGYDAVEEVKKNQHDIIFLDINMPGINGIEALKRIKQINNEQIVIMLTVIDDVDTVIKLIKEGANNYISKPVVAQELLHALYSASEKRSLVLENRSLQAKLNEEIKKQAEEELKENQERLDQVVETIAEGLYIVNSEGHIVFANKMAEKLFGIDREELYTRTYNDPRWSVKNEKGEPLGEDDYPFMRVKKTGKPVYGIELIAQYNSAKEMIFSINAAPLYSSTGNFQGMVATQEDISARKLAERSLRKVNQENEQLLAALPLAMIILNREFYIMKWNSCAETVFGMNADEVKGKSILECDIKWDRNKISKTLDYCKEAERLSASGDIKYTRADGKEGFIAITATPIPSDSSVGGGFLLIGDDVTERRILEGQLTQAQKLESIGSLASGIAHEINTPAQFVGDNIHFLEGAFSDIKTLMAKYSRLFEANKNQTLSRELVSEIESEESDADIEFLSKEIPKAIQSSLSGMERITTIVRAMNDYSHPGSKEKVPVDINTAINSTVTISRNEWKYVAEMKMDLDPSLGMIPCYPDEFNQVILNFITNAAYAIGKVVGDGSEKKGTITIQTKKEKDCAIISVKDTGSGIPDLIKDKVFDHFFTTKEVGRGTGQGLSISRSIIVDKHGGLISFKSREGKGTTFTIKLPLMDKYEQF